MKKLKNGIRGSGSSGGNQMASVKAMALMTGDSNVRGSLHFRQASTGGPTHIQGRISGLSPGLHGFHIHALGDTSNGCNSTGVAEVSLQDWLEFPLGVFPGRRAHSSPGGWRWLRAAVGLLLRFWALSGKSRRARLVGQGFSGKALRARMKEKDSVNFERCLCGALGIGLEAHNQG
ncbi:uncharacterized protein LOC126601010 isoform X3 [Malus sylvestris]|uniref:uncharacterized protein LOC126601010 isoform X3 n=1 Tax=Malus sylvestris TaxID=3752 RepID=UPI0021AC8723|nr:uncharacterized protein LOC126601010 isoform X3 [Malus sylvestris]